MKSCVSANCEDMYIDHLRNEGERLENFCINSTCDRDVFKQIKWVVIQNEPLSEVEHTLMCGIMDITAVSSKSSSNKYYL